MHELAAADQVLFHQKLTELDILALLSQQLKLPQALVELLARDPVALDRQFAQQSVLAFHDPDYSATEIKNGREQADMLDMQPPQKGKIIPIRGERPLQEKRREVRFNMLRGYQLTVHRMGLLAKKVNAVSILDLSASGCRLFVRTPLHVGQVVRLQVSFPAFGDRLTLVGEIRRVRELLPQQAYETGIQFIGVDPASLKIIHHLRNFFQTPPEERPASL